MAEQDDHTDMTHAAVDAEVHAEKVLEAVRTQHRSSPYANPRLWFSIATAMFATALVISLFIVNHQFSKNQSVSDCRTQVASDLRSADSEVVRANAIRQEYESTITEAWAGIVVQLAKPTQDRSVDAINSGLAEMDVARTAAAQATQLVNQAIATQDAARQTNRDIVKSCPS